MAIYVLKKTVFSFLFFVSVFVLAALMPRFVYAHQTGIEALLETKIHLVNKMNETAKSTLLNAVMKPEIETYFLASDPKQKIKIKRQLDDLALSISNQFGADEVCIIDAFGSEVSRVFHNHVAEDLSDAEGQTSFFRGGMETKTGEVFLSSPYISGDTNEWVMAYTTRISVLNRTRGILHLERSLRVLQELLYGGFGDDRHFIVAIDEGGWIIADSRIKINVKRDGEKVFPGDYFKRFVLSGVDIDVLTTGKDAGGGSVDNLEGAYIYTFKRIGPITLLAFERK